jgi:hypothetical protein
MIVLRGVDSLILVVAVLALLVAPELLPAAYMAGESMVGTTIEAVGEVAFGAAISGFSYDKKFVDDPSKIKTDQWGLELLIGGAAGLADYGALKLMARWGPQNKGQFFHALLTTPRHKLEMINRGKMTIELMKGGLRGYLTQAGNNWVEGKDSIWSDSSTIAAAGLGIAIFGSKGGESSALILCAYLDIIP